MFIGNLIELRSFEKKDLDTIMANFNNYSMRKYLNNPIPVSRHDEEKWLESIMEQKRKGTGYTFAMDDLKTRKLIGSASLMNVSQINRSSEMGITIHSPENWGKGYGSDALQLLLSIGFDILNLHSINLRVHEFNPRAKKLYEKCGFKVAGKLREAFFIEGKYRDVHYMDILDYEYRELIQNHPSWPKVSSKELD